MIDRDKRPTWASRSRISARPIRALIGGQEVTTFEEDGETYDVRVRLVESDRERPEAMSRACPCGPAAANWSNCATWSTSQEGTGPVQIDRQDRIATGHRHGQPERRKPLGAALDDVRRIEAGDRLARRASTRRSPATAR